MNIADILLLAVALSMDASAVAMTDGMTDPKMPFRRVALTGGLFGGFQAIMPLIGYFVAGLVANAFLDLFGKISAWVSFVLLAFLGGKMILDCIREARRKKAAAAASLATATEKNEGTAKNEKNSGKVCDENGCGFGRLALQALATSVDALAVGITLQMAAISAEGLFPAIGWTALIIGAVTFSLSVLSVYVGKLIGDKLADKAQLLGGVVLLGIGVKLLLEGLL